ncbi:hypothetical protein F4818DRAFT_119076 [Hypoxylon cercidicola]|nr:hypothetical protein F4818DRAFT_119076 [Hypoxylon cercidicola]
MSRYTAESIRYLVRPRVSSDFLTVYPSEAVPVTPSTRHIRLGGAMERLDSNLSMDISQNILYIDRPLPLKRLSVLDAFGTKPARSASQMPSIAINLSQHSPVDWKPLWMAVDNHALSNLILVCSSDKLKQHVVQTPSDEWGFREIHEDKVKAEEPHLYRSGLVAVGVFSTELPPYGMHYSFVYHWEEKDEESCPK